MYYEDRTTAGYRKPTGYRSQHARWNPHAGPARARVCQLDPGRVGPRANSSARSHYAVAADARVLRGRRAALPAARTVPGLPGAERYLPRSLLAALRLGRPRHDDLRPGRRVSAFRGEAAADLPQDARARAGAGLAGTAGSHPLRGECLLPEVRDARGVARAHRQ